MVNNASDLRLPSLEQTPPVPTYQAGSQPLHDFFGFDGSRHIVSLSLRDPLDAREMPPNGNSYVSASCMRGVRKVIIRFMKVESPLSRLFIFVFRLRLRTGDRMF